MAYRRHAGVAVVVGDPVGPPRWQQAAPALFAAHSTANALCPRVLGGCGHFAAVAAERRCRSPRTPSSTCRAWSSAAGSGRTSAPRATAPPRTASPSGWSPSPTSRGRAQAGGWISRDWLKGKRTPELGFTLGGVDQAMDPACRSASRSTSTAPCTASRPGCRCSTTTASSRLDLGHHAQACGRFPAGGGVPDRRPCLAFQAEGAAFVSLSGAPLARSGDGPASIERLLDLRAPCWNRCTGSTRCTRSRRSSSRAGSRSTWPTGRGRTAADRRGAGRAYLPDNRHPRDAEGGPEALNQR